ncbi:MAG: UDP-N-acetylmuramoyl-L-alanyl-D-glutamate--2,6-diaminopimelate ligase [Zoogloeaceae bacterium]|jgi:UDP-N-acetylmuramyl-tripeptide synthetase|nr:UDP-N-acetylmuramoyl-L-alanyl-D-glutamate--2,6-diaminopimelate ligase [Zoogloeaceae bacterium]
MTLLAQHLERLDDVARACLSALAQADLRVKLTGVTDDSRQVRPGDLFIAYPDHAADGRRYIGDALARGAAAVCWQPGEDFVWDDRFAAPNLAVPNLRPLAGSLAHELAGHPCEQLSLLAITGTNGKTSISQWLARAWPEPCGVIGTLGAGLVSKDARGADDLIETGFTTPKATTLARLLAEMLADGARACALEASSIGLEEGRLNGARVDTAIFTNFTRDHLDYHISMENYAAAKEKLFRWSDLRLAIINLDNTLGQHLAYATTARQVIGYSLAPEHFALDGIALVSARDARVTKNGQAFTLVSPWGEAAVSTPIPGRYNIANLLAVAAALLDAGVSVTETAARLSRLEPPPGRMQRYGGELDGTPVPLIAVDYSHTPDALDNALAALRPLTVARGGKLICVFGCGGDRDHGKRPLMGEIAAKNADVVWMTSDNPRSEDPLCIIEAIRRGVPVNLRGDAARIKLEADRDTAIRSAIMAASAQDVILLAGKGHETYQEIAGVRHHFHDGEQANAALRAWRFHQLETGGAA